ncbi:MAG: Ribosomal RNA large subunit methyltransferase H [Owenweeksia sp. TMED14]|nr:MAG: Ribosomal RNA large subunit methyltransferase H [Owenweeksia sp. TMED14]|tara:strand:+ start:3339 stop:3764 length:426 start_codon:yes stop_codon:yes gene_type:complete
MEIILLVVGSTKEKYIETGLNIYSDRLSKYSKFKIISLIDSRKINDFLKIGDKLILLDETGISLTSINMARQFQKWMNSGPKRLIFAIGDSYGFNKNSYQKADAIMSLGPMTFTHDMARLIFVEQLYRAWTILGNEPYHHD